MTTKHEVDPAAWRRAHSSKYTKEEVSAEAMRLAKASRNGGLDEQLSISNEIMVAKWETAELRAKHKAVKGELSGRAMAKEIKNVRDAIVAGVVDTYLVMQDMFRQGSLGIDSATAKARRQGGYEDLVDAAVDFYEENSDELDARSALARDSLAALNVAHVFEIPQLVAYSCYRDADVATTEQLGHKWTPAGEGDPLGDDGAKRYFAGMKRLANELKPPEHMPFDCCAFVIRGGVLMSDTQLLAHGMKDDVDSAIMLGWIVTGDSAFGFGITLAEVVDMLVPALYIDNVMLAGVWQQSLTLDPWVVNGIVDTINQYQSLTVERIGRTSVKLRKRKVEKALKKKMRVPPPFYRVTLQHSTAEDHVQWMQSSRSSREYSHRWEVRGHWRLRVARGDEPIDTETEAKFRRRRYKILRHGTPPDAETCAQLLKRDRRLPRRGEWMAVLKSWVDDYEKGPDDSPLVPAIRVIPGRN